MPHHTNIAHSWPFPEWLWSNINGVHPPKKIPVEATKINVANLLLVSDANAESLEKRCAWLEDEVAKLLDSHVFGGWNPDRASILYERIDLLSKSLNKLQLELEKEKENIRLYILLQTTFPVLRTFFLEHKDKMNNESAHLWWLRWALIRILLWNPRFKEFCDLFPSEWIRGKEESCYTVLLKVIPGGKTKINDVLLILWATPMEINKWEWIATNKRATRFRSGEHRWLVVGAISKSGSKAKFF